MDKYYYKLAKIVVFIGVIFFVSHLLFPQYVYAADTNNDQMRVDLSGMNIANSPEPIIYDDTDTDFETATLPVETTSSPATTTAAEPVKPIIIDATQIINPEEVKEYVRLEAIRAGLNPDEVEKIVKCESKFNPQAIHTNVNGSKDKGLWQINSIHKRISDADKLDYKAATKWAIAKRLHDGNWSAWYCARKLAIK